jgi:peptidoglycan/xylan/chitin deacetylase (PgdA/CDA1 family)
VAIHSEKQSVPILMYHSISAPASSGFRACTVSPALFDEHVSYLRQCQYTSVTVTQFAQAIARGGQGLPERPVILTFDDGYTDFYTHALPILQKHGFTATLYIPTAFVGGTCGWLQFANERYRPILTWTQLAEISASGIECGAHSHTHPPLNMLPPSVARDEIVRSKELLEDHLHQEVLSFAYPFGYYNTQVRQIVQAVGFSSACAIRRTLSSLHDNPYTLARLAITPDTRLNDLATALATGRGPLISSYLRQVRGQLRQDAQSIFGKLWYGRSAPTLNKETVLK